MSDRFFMNVKRSQFDDTGVRWQRYEVPHTGDSMSVLDALIWIQRNSDLTLAFRCACRVGMCGTCGSVINGRERLACRTQVTDMLDRGVEPGEVRIEPMRHLPVVRDLATDMSVFHSKIIRTVPHDIPVQTSDEFYAISPTSKERQSIEPQRECIYCGLCYSACSIVGLDEKFLGPAALNRAFIALLDRRNDWEEKGLAETANEQGLWRCHTLFECTAVCPKSISPTSAIQQLKRKAVAYRLKKLFRLT